MLNTNMDRFVRTPFQVKATKITDENIEDIAQMVGEVRTKNDEKYIALDRRIVPNVSRAYIGWYVTILGDNLRCYSPKVFNEQFVSMPENSRISFDFSDDDEEAPATVVDVDDIPEEAISAPPGWPSEVREELADADLA